MKNIHVNPHLLLVLTSGKQAKALVEYKLKQVRHNKRGKKLHASLDVVGVHTCAVCVCVQVFTCTTFGPLETTHILHMYQSQDGIMNSDSM